MATVWLVEHSDYEQSAIVGVWSSLECAVAGLKQSYGPPYIVEWDDVIEGRDHDGTGTGRYSLHGKFEGVQHYSTEHDAYYAIWPEEVDDGGLVWTEEVDDGN